MNTPFTPNTEGIFYDLPAATYHAAPGVSQSTCKAFDEAGSPMHFKTLKRKPPTPDMEFGTLVHAAVLEGTDAMFALCHVRPNVYPCEPTKKDPRTEKPWRGNAEWCEKWLEAHEDGKIIVDEKTLGLVNAAASSLRENGGIFSAALQASTAAREVSYFKRDAETGLLLKARVDLQVTTKAGDLLLFDPKKVQVGGGSEVEFKKQVKDYGYHIQYAAYRHITGATEMYFVPFDDDAPFECNVTPLSQQWQELGMLEYRRMLRAWAKCANDDQWPGYPRDGTPLPMPDYLTKRVKELNGSAYEVLHRGFAAMGGTA